MQKDKLKGKIFKRKVAFFLAIVVVVAIMLTVIAGLFGTLFVIGVRDTSVDYFGFPVAWSGLPLGIIYDYTLNVLVKYATSVLGFIIDICFFIGLIIIFTISIQYIASRRELYGEKKI